MNKTQTITLLIAITICLLAMPGFADNTVPDQSVGTADTHLSIVSFNETPVQYADINGVKLGYREFGSGEPVLMIEGFSDVMNDWNETFIGILSSKYHVYTYDHRGMGYSSDNNVTPSISQYADDAVALMSALGYDSMNVYGASMGSSISQQLVINHPECVRKLVLDSNTYNARIPETRKLLDTLKMVAVNSSIPVGIREEAQANLAWNGSYDGLSGISKDVMLVVGTADVVTPDAVSVQMTGQINGSWLVRFKGLPHTGYKYAPVEYGQNALNFLDMNESPA